MITNSFLVGIYEVNKLASYNWLVRFGIVVVFFLEINNCILQDTFPNFYCLESFKV